MTLVIAIPIPKVGGSVSGTDPWHFSSVSETVGRVPWKMVS